MVKRFNIYADNVMWMRIAIDLKHFDALHVALDHVCKETWCTAPDGEGKVIISFKSADDHERFTKIGGDVVDFLVHGGVLTEFIG